MLQLEGKVSAFSGEDLGCIFLVCWSKLGLVSLALFIGCCVSCILSECWRKTLYAISLRGVSAKMS